MKTVLKLSLFSNLALFGSLIYLLSNLGKENRESLPLVPNAWSSVKTESLLPPAGSTFIQQAKTFHWSQIESADYRAYIANLRQIGCPEQTIRDIVKADLDTLYAARRDEISRRPATGNLSRNRSGAGGPLQVELKALREEEASVIELLFGSGDSATRIAVDTAVPVRAARNPSRARPASFPLVLQSVDLAALKLNADQMEAITDLRQKFLDDIGGANQDPDDPAYRERWEKSRPEIDDMLKGMIGISAFLDYQVEVAGNSPDETGADP